MRIGFIGVGAQGAPIAHRIADAGFDLVVSDRNHDALQAFAGKAHLETDPLALAAAADVVSVCVRTDRHLLDIAGDSRLFAAMPEGGVFVIHSTVSPELCRSLAAAAKAHGITVVDAPVSGGAQRAASGHLVLLVGGEAQAVRRVRPVLESYGDPICYFGPCGRGMTAKLLNNLLLTANLELAAATLEMGRELGLDLDLLHTALLAGTSRSHALEAAPNLLSAGRSEALTLLVKDCGHAFELGGPINASVGALTHAAQAFQARLQQAAAMARP